MSDKEQVHEKEEDKGLGQNQEVGASEAYVENNVKKIGGVAGIIIAVIVGAIFFYNSSTASEEEDQKSIFRAQYYFSLDSLNLALFGDDSGKVNSELIGFDELTGSLSSSKVKNLNNFYVGVINLQNGEYQQAIDYLSDFSTNDDLLEAKAKEQLGNAYMELAETEPSNYNDAIKYYTEASSLAVNEAFTPGYLMKLALAYELNGDKENAIKTYEKVISGFSSSVVEVSDAKKYKTVLEFKKSS
jgi:tetratricopeptide (TPR) repeat protein